MNANFSQHDKNETFGAAEERFIRSFDRKILSFVRVNGIFITAFVIECILFSLFLPFFLKSAFLAIIIAVFFLTIFSYFILKQYLESQKLSYFEALLENFLSLNQDQFAKSSSKEIEIAKICTRIAHRLYQREYKYYAPPKFLGFLYPLTERISAWMHWHDVHQMRELLLDRAVEEHIKLVRKEPTNPDVHAHLANAYVMLSGLYVKPGSLENMENERWVPEQKYGENMHLLFQEAAKNAVEEFKILKEYAPNDPWIYMQLAYSYRDLKMPEDEKEAYESILSLRPQDHETRFNLGMLYFRRGDNARGLKEFEELKKAHYSKADELLCIYGQRN